MNNNKLIAEFMGAEPDKKTFFLKGEKVYFYDTSWDWLMPVVSKISSMCDEPYELDNMKHALLTADIDSVYDGVVEFIKDNN